MPEPQNIEQLIAMIVLAGEGGNPPSQESWLRKYPKYETELREFFEIHDQFEAAASAMGKPATQPTEPSQQQPSSSLSLPPKHLGNYEILEEIDRGGMGVVYKARHRELGRIVALKLIRSGELASENEVQRFRSEAEAAAALTHPGIVPIYEVGMLDGLVYYTMAYIQGQNLAEFIQTRTLEPIAAVRLLRKLCDAVEHAHASGVFHRDIKPANVLVDHTGQPILIDFGLAKMAHQDLGLTSAGQILGTPAYMAPEHASGKSTQPTRASDVYSLGAILYYLCARQAPFIGPTPFDVLLQVLDREPVPPSKLNRRVTHELDFVCQRAMEKNPQARYQSAAEFGRDLQRLVHGQPIDCPLPTVVGRLEAWWRREPILLVHLCGIGLTTAIVALSHWIRGVVTEEFPVRLLILLTWLVASFVLQYWVVRDRWRDIACLTWATVDVSIYTTLIAFAAPPRSMLLIGYPMMIVASSLFYRKRFVGFMTACCASGFLTLAIFAPMEDFVRPDFAAIFVCGLGVICLTLLTIIRRVRSMSVFYDDP